MLMSFDCAYINQQDVYRVNQGYGAKAALWVIEKPIAHRGRIWAVEMRQVDMSTWELSNTVKTFDNQSFLMGSGFGGGPYLVPDFFYKVKNGAIFYQFMENEVIPKKPSLFEKFIAYFK
jgi:hypothetical protein